MTFRKALFVIPLLFTLLMLPGAVATAQESVKEQKKREAQAVLNEGQASGSLPDGVFIRVSAHLFRGTNANEKLRVEAKARGVPFQETLDEMWEFTANRVYRVVSEQPPHKPGEKFEYVYRRVDSRPFDAKNLCKELLDGKALEIREGKGTGEPMMYVGTDFKMGGRSIELHHNGDDILFVGEHCTHPGYPESNARAFAALYEKLASQARASFKPGDKATPAKEIPQFKPISEAILSAKSLTLYEGLPHQLSEAEVYKKELASKKIIQLHDYPFYDRPLGVTADDVELLRNLSASANSYIYGGPPKGCEGFHPDYCLAWKDGESTYHLLICFGCNEMMIFNAKSELLKLDIPEEASKKFEAVLKKYPGQRPKTE